MSHIQQILQLLQSIVQSNNSAIIVTSEQSLKAFSNQNPLEYVLALIEILKMNETKQVKSLAILRLEKGLVWLLNNKLWIKLSQEEQANIRNAFSSLIGLQSDYSVKSLLASVFGEIAGQFMLSDIKNWPKFEEEVYKYLQGNTDQEILIGLKILNAFFNYASHVFDKRGDQLYVVFKNSFTHQNNKVKEIGIKAYCGFLTTCNKKAQTKMQSLIVPFLQCTYHLIANDNHNIEGLELISDLVEVFPRMLKNNFAALYEMLSKVMAIKDLSDGSKKIATQSLITLTEKYPEIFRQDKAKLQQLIEMIFLHMIAIDQEITEEWKKPAEGYSEDFQKGEDFEATNFGMLSIDRLITAISQQQTVPAVSITIQKMLQVNDWRYKFASLMALSEVGQHIEEIDDLKSVVQMLLSYVSNQNPMIRFAAIHSLGQTAEDQRPEFQQTYGKECFLKLAPLLQDTVPRVVSHAAASLSNVIQGMQYEEIAEHAQQLMSLLLTLATTSISLVKTSVLGTISAIAMTGKQKFLIYFQKTSQILFSIIDHHKAKEYKQLKGTVIQTLTTIANSIGKEHFKSAAPHLIEYLITIQQSQLEDVDPQKQYVLQGWQKLCAVFGRDLESYLPRILPSLFIIVQKIVQKNIKHATIENILTQGGDESKINTFQTQQAESAIAMLNIFIEQTKQLYLPYIERTAAILLAVVKSQINENVKLQAFIGIPLILRVVKKSNLNGGIEYAKNFLSILVGVCHTTEDSTLQSEQVECLQQIFKCFGGNKFLQAEQLTEFSKQVVQLLIKSKERRNANDKEMGAIEDIQNDEIEYYSDQLSSEEEVQVALSNLIGEILKTHKEMNLGLVQYVLETELPRVFVEGATSKMIKFGIFLVDDMVDHLGYEIMKGQWNDFGQVFIKYSNSVNCSIRQAACYGLGSFAEKTPSEIFLPLLTISLDLLVQANNIPRNEKESDKAHKACTDNVVSAIGKIIKAHGSTFNPRPYLSIWLNSLPLRTDEVEAVTQHRFLTEILLNDQTLLIPDQSQQSVAALTKILKIFGDVAKTRVSKPEINQSIKQILAKFKTQSIFYGNSDRLWASLTQNQAKKLTDLIKN